MTISCFHVLQFMVRAAAKLLGEEPEMLYQVHLTTLWLVEGVTVLWGTKGQQEQRCWWALLAATVLSPVQGIFSRLWQILFLLKRNTWDINWVFLDTHCNWSIAEKGWRPVALPWNTVTHAEGEPRAGVVRHPPLLPPPSTAPWHLWGCLKLKRV